MKTETKFEINIIVMIKNYHNVMNWYNNNKNTCIW